MTDRQKKFVREYGPRFVARSRMIETQLLHMAADAVSCMNDEECETFSDAMSAFIDSLNKCEEIVSNRIEQSLNEGEDFITLYDKAKKELKRFI